MWWLNIQNWIYTYGMSTELHQLSNARRKVSWPYKTWSFDNEQPIYDEKKPKYIYN